MPNSPVATLPRYGSVNEFHGSQRTPTSWDALRKDVNLWFPDGDCLVYFQELDASPREPSLRLRYSDVQSLESSHLLERCLPSGDTLSPPTPDNAASDNTESHPPFSSEQYKLYLPAPEGLTKEQSYHHHLAARNCFAFAASSPLVGQTLGDAFTQVHGQLQEWKSTIHFPSKIWSYCDEQGYSDMARNTDHALANLALAEQAKMRDLWIESFVHCVGQREELFHSSEYEAISQGTKSLIFRASLEMDIHVERAIRALGSFLEEELGAEQLGLGKSARDHLDRFRSCLINYYVEKFGYFPPQANAPYNKRMWTKMYNSFGTIYEYLVDIESDTDPSSTRGANGGICVIQNIKAFDQKHGYTPLPHPLPLLPADAPMPKIARRRTFDGQRALLGFKLARSDSVTEVKSNDGQALAEATNALEPEVGECALLQEYKRFERQRLEEKLSMSEARKVRWLLIYGVLQMLTSITWAPLAVRDSESPAYPMCMSTDGLPPWDEEDDGGETSGESSQRSSMLAVSQNASGEIEDRISIHPDCEADNAEDFFAATHSLSRQASDMDLGMTPPSLRLTTQPSRTASLRYSVNALQRSVVGSLARRNSTRSRAGAPSARQGMFFGDVMLEGQDMSPIDSSTQHFHRHSFSTEQSPSISTPSDFALFDFGLQQSKGKNHEPTLQDDHLPALNDSARASPIAGTLERSASDSSNRSSLFGAGPGSYDSSATDVSTSWPDKELKIIGVETALEIPLTSTPSSKRVSFQEPEKQLSVYTMRSSSYSTSVNAGVYVPTGYTSSVYIPTGMGDQSRGDRRNRNLSVDSMACSPVGASPIYKLEDNTQGSIENEEEHLRGRRRSKVLLDLIPETDG